MYSEKILEIAGNSLESKQLSYSGDTMVANSNGFGIVTSFRIGQSNAAKLLNN